MNQFKLGFSTVKSYLDDRITLKKLEGLEAVGKLISTIVFFALLAIFFVFLVIFLSLAGAFYLGDAFDYGKGFLIVSGIYLLLIILLALFRKALQGAIINMIIAASPVDKNENEN